ncbi:MAG: hypothetical protein GEU80_01670 [Dehalococcoidia bacterium]|nr:hypothetical protein [Dehalococcoidia bacterium]
MTAPVDLAAPDDGSGRLFLVEQTGTIRIVGEDGEVLDEPFLDLTDRLVELEQGYDERGLLGLAFHPEYADNGRFYVYYSAPLADDAPDGWDHTSHVAEFTVSADDENVADPESERTIMQVNQPQRNHNGGHITFGRDGYLYIPLGDGGGGDDIEEGHTPDLGNGQDRTNFLGSLLRIDVDREGEGGLAYAIPEDNPFVDDAETPPEIWAYGLRNPYDISVDAEGEYGILISDAGQELYEEVTLAFGGENFGWNLMEGTHCFDPQNPEVSLEDCPAEDAGGNPLVGPVVEYHRADMGTAVAGAHIYRGEALPDWQGLMVFVDWNVGGDANGGVFVAAPNDNLDATDVDEGLWEFEQVELAGDLEGAEGDSIGRYITGLTSDAANELYILTNTATGPEAGAGEVFRLVPPAEGE